MSADFWSGYVSGAVGIIIGNPLDLIKVRLQAKDAIATQTTAFYAGQFRTRSSLVAGTAAPVLGYGALNALLFVSYNRSVMVLDKALGTEGSLWSTWIAGAIGGLATWVVSTPTELIKCRAQTAPAHTSSWSIARRTWKSTGLRGLYFGGGVTALRDSIGYGFYFWTYALCSRAFPGLDKGETTFTKEATKVLVCGGLAGIATWASIFPLDVIKTRVQTQSFSSGPVSPLVISRAGSLPVQYPVTTTRYGAVQVAKRAYREGGLSVFFRGFAVCSIRAFLVNAAQWAVYEWMMHELGQGRGHAEQSD